MKLRNQGIILLGLPLACQLIFAVVLGQSVLQMVKAGEKEAQAKNAMAICQLIRNATMRAGTLLVAQKYISNQNLNKRLLEVKESMLEGGRQLETVVSGDPRAMVLAKEYNKSLKEYSDVLTLITVPDDGKEQWQIAQFSDDNEYYEESFLTYRRLAACDDRLVDHFIPVVKEFQPESIEQKRNLVWQISLAAGANVLLVVVLSVMFGRTTLNRLSILMRNIRLFSVGDDNLVTVSGDDELAELDKEFKQMAVARHEAENMRRSIQAMVSHDLRTPLTSVNLSLSMILKETGTLPTQTAQRLQRIGSEMHRLVRMADSFLDMERIESGKLELELEDTDVSWIFESAAAAVSGVADAKSIEIDWQILAAEKIFCDRDRVIQVLVNLLSNALKFSPKKSTVTVRAELIEPNMVQFSVEDAGPGIPLDMREKLFQRFSQLEREHELKRPGSGFGLYVCQMIVEAHRGTIGVAEPDHTGAKFWFQLPMHDSSSQITEHPEI
ncbi:MAG: HAMP domain-containing histidine kinase [Cyanobacteria bacterium]|nr:HAMP domain-containing histidine kinase [Cyanobacteriota bacterium]